MLTECVFLCQSSKYDDGWSCRRGVCRVADNIVSELSKETEDIGCLRDRELLAF